MMYVFVAVALFVMCATVWGVWRWYRWAREQPKRSSEGPAAVTEKGSAGAGIWEQTLAPAAPSGPPVLVREGSGRDIHFARTVGGYRPDQVRSAMEYFTQELEQRQRQIDDLHSQVAALRVAADSRQADLPAQSPKRLADDAH